MIMLVKALAAFFILVYIHISYSQTPATCLEHLKTEGWPRDGILRVEIMRPGEVKVPMKEGAEDMSEELTMLRINNKGGMVSIDPSTTLPHEEQNQNDPTYKNSLVTSPPDQLDENRTLTEEISFTQQSEAVNASSAIEIEVSESVSSTLLADSSSFTSDSIEITDSEMNTKETFSNETIAKINDQQFEEVLKSDIPEVEKLMNAVFPDDQYVVECECSDNDLIVKNFLNHSFVVDSLEYGFLRLSAATRQRLNIPVKVVTLDPQSDKCFGDSFSRFILHEFLGYDDLLMASVKVLAEQEDNKGYLRNVITGEHYRFVSMWWMQRGSYLASFFIMILFVRFSFLHFS